MQLYSWAARRLFAPLVVRAFLAKGLPVSGLQEKRRKAFAHFDPSFERFSCKVFNWRGFERRRLIIFYLREEHFSFKESTEGDLQEKTSGYHLLSAVSCMHVPRRAA